MGIIISQSIRNSVATYVGIALGLITTLYLYPNILSQDQYGLTRLLLAASAIFAQFSQLGMGTGVIKFFPKFQDSSKDKNGFLFLSLLVPFFGYLLFFGAFFLFKYQLISYYSKSALFEDHYILILPIVLSLVYFNILNAYTRALSKSIPGTLVSEVYLRLLVIALLVFYYFGKIDFEIFLLGFAMGYASQFILMAGYLLYIGEFKIKPNFEFLDLNTRIEIRNYNFFSFFGGISNIVVSNIDIIMLGALLGLSDTAVYTIAFYIGSVIIVPQKSIGKIAPSLISRYLHEENYPEVEKIYKSSSINQLILGSLFFIGIWANLDNILAILPDNYSEAGWVIIVIGLSRLINMGTGLNGVILINSKFYKFDLVATLFLISFTVLSNYLLIPMYGILGAAIATALSLLFYNTIKFFYVWIKLSMQPFSIKIILVIIWSALILALSLQVPQIGGLYIDIIVRSFSIALLFSTGVIFFNFSDEISKMWISLKKRISN